MQGTRIFKNKDENESGQNDGIDEEKEVGDGRAQHEGPNPTNRFWQRTEREPDQVDDDRQNNQLDASPADRRYEFVDQSLF